MVEPVVEMCLGDSGIRAWILQCAFPLLGLVVHTSVGHDDLPNSLTYQSAEQLVAWLGDSDVGANLAFQAIIRLTTEILQYYTEHVGRGRGSAVGRRVAGCLGLRPQLAALPSHRQLPDLFFLPTFRCRGDIS